MQPCSSRKKQIHPAKVAEYCFAGECAAALAGQAFDVHVLLYIYPPEIGEYKGTSHRLSQLVDQLGGMRDRAIRESLWRLAHSDAGELVTTTDQWMTVRTTEKGFQRAKKLFRREEDFARECLRDLRAGCRRHGSKRKLSLADVEKYDAALSDLSTNELFALVSKGEVPEKAQLVVRCAAKQIQSQLRSSRGAKNITWRTLGHLFASVTEKQARGGVNTVIVDTNVLARLVGGGTRSGTMSEVTLRSLGESLYEGKFIVLDRTLEEFSSMMSRIGHLCQAIEHRTPTAATDPDALDSVLDKLTPLGEEYFASGHARLTFSDFVKDKLLEVRGVLPLRSIPATRKWHPKIVRARSVVSTDEFNKAMETLEKAKAEGRWVRFSGRPEEQGQHSTQGRALDEHDVYLVLAAAALAKGKPEGECRIWTHHRKMVKLCEVLGKRADIVMYGPPVLSPTTNTRKREQMLWEYLKYLLFGEDREAARKQMAAALDEMARQAGADQEELRLAKFLAEYSVDMPTDIEADDADRLLGGSEGSALGVDVVESGAALADFVEGGDDDWLDATLDWGKSPGAHGTNSLRIMREADVKGLKNAVVWEFCPHTFTHCDLPWAIDESVAREHQLAIPPVDAEQGRAMLDRIVRAHIEQCVILDFSDRQTCLDRYVDAKHPQRAIDIPDGDSLLEMVDALRIRQADLVRVAPKSAFGDRLVIIRTGWMKFMPSSGDIQSPWWECRHPFLLHPWLDESATELLIGEGARGLAIDAPMADCPLYVAASLMCEDPELMRTALDYVRDLPVQPTHLGFLGRGMPMIELLDIPNEVSCWFPEATNGLGKKRRYAFCDLALLPLRCSLMHDCVPLKCFLARDEMAEE